MKYIFLLSVLLSCKSGPRKVVVAHHDQDTATQLAVKRDTCSIDLHDPFETGKDTVRLNKVIGKIFKFPEVEAINKQIDKSSKGTHGVSIMVHDEFNGETSYYHFMVGDNSHEDRFANIFNFLLDKKTNEIKAYDPALDSVLSLQDWRKTRK
ncbi:hypothetical protein [Flavisolibacter nicotianae]|uniref:hypothetical protein n=1 Tax=Flavisolibacter nicotianae TaxID=2364882 RepID=UPI0013C4764D|nr:hypothetical protein [Flavisolibacter nicotianae]